MIFVGIDVAKDKHDCFIISSEGEVLSLIYIFIIPKFVLYVNETDFLSFILSHILLQQVYHGCFCAGNLFFSKLLILKYPRK